MSLIWYLRLWWIPRLWRVVSTSGRTKDTRSYNGNINKASCCALRGVWVMAITPYSSCWKVPNQGTRWFTFSQNMHTDNDTFSLNPMQNTERQGHTTKTYRICPPTQFVNQPVHTDVNLEKWGKVRKTTFRELAPIWHTRTRPKWYSCRATS